MTGIGTKRRAVRSQATARRDRSERHRQLRAVDGGPISDSVKSRSIRLPRTRIRPDQPPLRVWRVSRAPGSPAAHSRAESPAASTRLMAAWRRSRETSEPKTSTRSRSSSGVARAPSHRISNPPLARSISTRATPRALARRTSSAGTCHGPCSCALHRVATSAATSMAKRSSALTAKPRLVPGPLPPQAWTTDASFAPAAIAAVRPPDRRERRPPWRDRPR